MRKHLPHIAMQHITLFFLLVLSVSANAKKFEINKMSVLPDFTQAFLLEHSEYQSYYGILDCQSFLQKLDFFDSADQVIAENFITINECVFFFEQVQTCFEQGKPKCFDMSDIYSDSCECTP